MRRLILALCVLVLAGGPRPAQAGSVKFNGLTGTSGSFTSLGGTSVNYTIAKYGDLTAPETASSPPYTTTHGTFTTDSDLPYFKTTVTSPNGGLTIDFSKPVEAKDLVLIFGDIVISSSSGQYASLSLSGSTGTATLAAFNLIDTGVPFGNTPDTDVSYNPSTGVIRNNDTTSAATIFLGSTSTETLTSITLYAQQPIYPFEMAVGVASVPEPSSIVLAGIAAVSGLVVAVRRRRK